MKNQAFTLIEILVVVLIIGILAAIALPQYQRAVAKAELSQIISVVKSIKEAQDIYFLTNNKYSMSLNNLDVVIKDEAVSCDILGNETDNNAVKCKNKNFAFLAYISIQKIECAAKTQNTNSPLAYACSQLTDSEGTLRSWQICNGLVYPCIVSDKWDISF